jgi:DNA-directed RNA polymerase subunit RPC12/RpoP
MQVTADIKCYYCGHISGQLISEKDHPETGVFRPRPGYQGAKPEPGKRIRCERCGGPVYLEDVSPAELPFMRTRSKRRQARSPLSGAA